MKFTLDYQFIFDDEIVSSQASTQTANYKDQIAAADPLEGSLLIALDGEKHCGDYVEPLFRLGGQWARKIPWILAGDTETVAYRNSEHCFAFVPAGDSVEFSFFMGSETEVEDYVIEPTIVRLDAFVTQSIRVMDELIAVMRKADPSRFDTDEDLRDLVASLEEAKKAWRDYQLHQRR